MSRAFLALASVLVAACGSSSIDDIPSEADAGADAIEAPEEDAGITPEDASTTEEDASPPPEQDAAPPEQDATAPPPPEPNPKCPTSVKNPAAYTGINANPKFLQVYVNNVENLELPTDQCHGDWKECIRSLAWQLCAQAGGPPVRFWGHCLPQPAGHGDRRPARLTAACPVLERLAGGRWGSG